MKKKTVILIPSLNPNEILLDYVKELISTSKSVDVIVVNDGSKEECVRNFTQQGCRF